MSALNIDYAVEISVRCLNKSKSEIDVRSLFNGLNEFARRYDTRFWQFQMVAPLLRHRFVYALPASEHPDYDRFPPSFMKKPFQWIYRDPTRSWDINTNPTVGRMSDLLRQFGMRLITDGWGKDIARVCMPALEGRNIFFNAGSELWRRFVELGKLTGPDAVSPRFIPVDEVAVTVAREAELQGNPLPVRAWLIQLFWDMYRDKGDDTDLDELKQNPHVRELRAIAKRMGAIKLEMPPNIFPVPTEEDSYVPVQARWWFDLSLDT